jgi:hypothetical protein
LAGDVLVVEKVEHTRLKRRFEPKREREGRGLFAGRSESFPPASEREARMDDPIARLA